MKLFSVLKVKVQDRGTDGQCWVSVGSVWGQSAMSDVVHGVLLSFLRRTTIFYKDVKITNQTGALSDSTVSVEEEINEYDR